MSSMNHLLAGLGIVCALATGTAYAQTTTPGSKPPGSYTTSWIGNSFGGGGGDNGFGEWVQDGADEIKVAPDGTVFAGVGWDEAGRCVGLYKDGKVNRILLQGGKDVAETAWGWGTGNNALAVYGDAIYIANGGKKLLRFRWKPGDLNSGQYQDSVAMRDEAIGMTADREKIVVVYKDAIETRRASDLTVTGSFAMKDAHDVVLVPDGSVWVLAGGRVRHLSAAGAVLSGTVSGLQNPSAISLDNRGRLLICDNGPRQQVLSFDVSSSPPRQVAAFGKPGGLLAGTPGQVEPQKLFALRGAGTDVQGNLYVGMSYGNGPNGNFVLRSFAPKGTMRLELYATAFVDTLGFDPMSDGATVYSRTARFDLDLKQSEPGHEAKLRSFTLDPVLAPNDDRARFGCTTIVRQLNGRRLLYCIGQYAGGYRLYTFDKGDIAVQVDKVGTSDQWAWDVAPNGDIWHGDAPGKTIRRYAFRGWRPDGKPNYDWNKPQSWQWPEGWDLVRRIKYDPAADTLYIIGYLTGQRVETWGVIGATARRYDGWLAGKKQLQWTNSELPRDGNTDVKEGPLTAQSLDIAGDYLFLGMVKSTGGKQLIHIMRAADGHYVGALSPTGKVGNQQGWLDMPYAVQALKRKNGEYLILVEEDFRAKNLLYRWLPDAGQKAPGRASHSVAQVRAQ